MLMSSLHLSEDQEFLKDMEMLKMCVIRIDILMNPHLRHNEVKIHLTRTKKYVAMNRDSVDHSTT